MRLGPSLDTLRAAGELVALRVRLDALLAARPLDALLVDLVGPAPLAARADHAALERALDAVDAVLARVPRLPNTCLYRALARYVVLRRRGWPGAFVVGLPADGSDGAGHAWLELNGAPHRDDEAASMVATFRFGPASTVTPR